MIDACASAGSSPLRICTHDRLSAYTTALTVLLSDVRKLSLGVCVSFASVFADVTTLCSCFGIHSVTRNDGAANVDGLPAAPRNEQKFSTTNSVDAVVFLLRASGLMNEI